MRVYLPLVYHFKMSRSFNLHSIVLVSIYLEKKHDILLISKVHILFTENGLQWRENKSISVFILLVSIIYNVGCNYFVNTK